MHRFHLKADFLLNREINELYVTHALRSFAVSMIAIFIPIFLLKQGYSLIGVGLFLVLRSLFGFISVYTAISFATRHGVKRCMLISVPANILFFLCLYSIDMLKSTIGDLAVIPLLAGVLSVGGAFYWMGYHIDFARFSEEKNTAKQLSILNVIALGFSIIGPLAGALIITYLSFDVLFIVVMILLFSSMVPPFLSAEIHEPMDLDLKKTVQGLKKRNAVPFIAEGMHFNASVMVWPVLLFLMFSALDSIGGLYTISNGILVLFTMFVGRKTNNANRRRILKWGVGTHSATLAGRTFLDSLNIVAVVQGLGALTWSMVLIPFHAIFYSNSKKTGVASAIFFREFYLDIGRIVIGLIMISLLFVFPAKTALSATIIIAACTTWLMSRLKEEAAGPHSSRAEE
ncbi:MFS transporter [Candidatus Woesearchaeota archaeon]|nr:MFS transporter [Candidatus Woesearchaeota archaeon]